MSSDYMVGDVILVIMLLVGIYRIRSNLKVSAAMKAQFSRFFPGLKKSQSFMGVTEVLFDHCGMEGHIKLMGVRNGNTSSVEFKPSSGRRNLLGGLSIGAAKLGLGDKLSNTSDEEFLDTCKVDYEGSKLSGKDLPKAVQGLLMRLRKIAGNRFFVILNSGRFEVNIGKCLGNSVQLEELVAITLALLKEMVDMRLNGISLDKEDLPNTYSSVNFQDSEYIPQGLNEYVKEHTARDYF